MPSDQHRLLQNLVHRWIKNRSFKMCALTECVAVGYVADFVALAGMHSEQHDRYTRYAGLEKKYMRSVWQGKGKPLKREIHGDIDRWYVCVFEVKVSRADFLNTFGNKKTPHAKARMKPVGTAHWVVAEKGVCEPAELPDFWGLLMPYGTGLTEKKVPRLNVLPDTAIHSIAFDMLWASKNYRTSYYEQMVDMARATDHLYSGILLKKPYAELMRRAKKLIKASRGLAVG